MQGTKADMKTIRKGSERIYQWAVYNDLGNPADPDNIRPVLGGGHFKYPRYSLTPQQLPAVL